MAAGAGGQAVALGAKRSGGLVKQGGDLVAGGKGLLRVAGRLEPTEEHLASSRGRCEASARLLNSLCRRRSRPGASAPTA